MASVTVNISDWLASYFDEMSLMLMATLLVVYGDIINRQVKRSLSGLHFVIRSSLFVLLCAFGYGALTLYGAPFLQHIFQFVAYEYRGLAFVLAFFALGIAAERRRYI
ncbi:hypothetical protein BFC17_18155 [Alteromonas lipolytica]|uniref:DUF3392 domain-containing protein n=1 Tax=Alteromonas lipolytica TaxID=1856405 RepID=A0A1E8FES2_9ALTE|nr:hypothetical protein BFC17_18155 [Alteromonas lipolytica]